MRTLVMKFGGTSLPTVEHFSKVAEIIVEKRKSYDRIVVVASAMAGMTDELIAQAKAANPNPPKREYDLFVSAGERMSSSLLAIALQGKGIDAASLTGSQAGIITCDEHADAKVLEVRPHRVFELLEKGKVPIIAGFQGVSRNKEVTTLGRGGSDTTAVVLGAALKAELIEFYKDVEGVYCSDPKTNPNAMIQKQLTYDEALQLLNEDNAFLHPRCIQFAKKEKLNLRFGSYSNYFASSTLIC